MYSQLIEQKLQQLKDSGQYREFVTIDRVCGQYPLAWANRKMDKKKVVWCSNDYLGMSQNPLVTDAMHAAIRQYGAGSGGSRNIGGSHYQYDLLESSIADWHCKEAALVFPTGYSSNDTTLQCLLRLLPNCIVFSDQLNHASIINGLCSTSVEKAVFRHNDMIHLEQLLKAQPIERPKLIVFESIYSMDGDIAPVKKVVSLAKQYNALTFLDEVHAIGMYGTRGAGIAAQLNLADDIDFIQGTMAKAIGIIGGYICSTSLFIDAIRSFASGFIFTTALPPAIVAGCYTSIEYLKQSEIERNKLHDKTRQIRQLMFEVGIPLMITSQTHILPVLIGDAQKCKEAANRLLNNHNIYLQPINSPTVPTGTERFRVNVTPNHTDDHIEQLIDGLIEVFNYFDISFMTDSFHQKKYA